MDLSQIESEAMHLSDEERAVLAQRLLLSLGPTSDESNVDDWLSEARRRAQELDEGSVVAIPAEEVRRKALALLR